VVCKLQDNLSPNPKKVLVSPQASHKVEFRVEDGCIWILNAKCIADKGSSCRTGCPAPWCEDWSHGPDGCEHCQNMCECGDTCPPVRQEHGDGLNCPHEFTDIDCWVIPWITECDPHDWFHDIVREHVVTEDEHPERIYEIVSNDWLYIEDNSYELSKFDFSTLRRIG
jgi:hypothetical protein